MVVVVENVTVSSVWAESFKGRDGDTVEFYRALLAIPNEAPAQIGVRKDDYPELVEKIGQSGTAEIEIDAKPGNRVRVYLNDLV